jgi:hypothetical protein
MDGVRAAVTIIVAPLAVLSLAARLFIGFLMMGLWWIWKG